MLSKLGPWPQETGWRFLLPAPRRRDTQRTPPHRPGIYRPPSRRPWRPVHRAANF